MSWFTSPATRLDILLMLAGVFLGVIWGVVATGKRIAKEEADHTKRLALMRAEYDRSVSELRELLGLRRGRE